MKILFKILPLATIFIGLLVLVYWLAIDPTKDFSISEPNDNEKKELSSASETINIGEHFLSYSSSQTKLFEIWPNFRGTNYNNIYTSNTSLINNFKNNNFEILWSVELGEGHAGAAIYEGMVYVLDYDEDIRADMLRCFSLEDGKEIWRRWYDVQIRRNHGMSRTVPAVSEKYIVTIGPRGHVMCVERNNGNFLWGINIEKEFESEIPLWYTGQCPIIIENTAIIATGGNALMIGVDCSSGKILWQTPNPNNIKMSHSSIVPFYFANQKMYVYSGVGGLVGVAANGENTGSILWQTNEWNHPVVAPTPICMPNGNIFLTAGYGAGSMLLQLTQNNGRFNIKVINSYKPGDGLSCEQQTPILDNDFLFGILPKDAKSLRSQFVCVNANNPTQIIWSSGTTARFGLGPYILADNKFYLLNDDATLYVIEKNTKEYIELDKIKLFDGYDAWAPLAVANGYMILRDSKTMICINLNK